jgi:hypothetical protein
MHKIDKIYLDLDGVIANFTKRYKEVYGVDPDSKRGRKDFNDNFGNFIKTKQFETLELLPDASLLIEYLKNQELPVEILSSTGRPENHEEVSRQKTVWLCEHGIPFKGNFVPGKELKKNFASPTSLIIDDTLSVIDDWKEAGGPAIHHKNARDTIVMLKFYLL